MGVFYTVFYMLVVCFHVVLQLYFASALGEVSSVDVVFGFFYPFFSAKAKYNGQLFNIKEIIFQCDFSIIKQKTLLLALYSVFSVESQDEFYCRAKKGINSPIRNCDSNIGIPCLFCISSQRSISLKRFCYNKALVIRGICRL